MTRLAQLLLYLGEARTAVGEFGAYAAGDDPVRVTIPAGEGAPTDLVFRAARSAGVQLRGLAPVRRTLEDVFLDAVEEPHAG